MRSGLKQKQVREISIAKRVSWQHLPEHVSLAVSDELEAIDEGVEGDFDGSDNVDISLIKAFRDRLKQIQERKNSRKNLLEKSKSLRCAFSAQSAKDSMGFAIVNLGAHNQFRNEHGVRSTQTVAEI